MALSNSQYNAVMRDYQRQQLQNRHEQEDRAQSMYRRIPQLREMEVEITACAAACARKALEQNPAELAGLREKLADLREQKTVLIRSAGYPADYAELKYRCPDCCDTGYRDGRKCHCFEEACRKLLYAQSNIREILTRENFDTFSFDYYDDSRQVPELGMTERQWMNQVVKKCREFVEGFEKDGGNLLIAGNTGVGKTFLANCIAKELIDRYVSVIYLSSHDLFDVFSKHKFSYDAEEEVEEIYHSILDCDMLIIDDLGAELNNSFVSSQLFYCVNERIIRKKGTIISTNLTIGTMRDLYSDRVASRIASSYATIFLHGSDIRMKKRQFPRD